MIYNGHKSVIDRGPRFKTVSRNMSNDSLVLIHECIA